MTFSESYRRIPLADIKVDREVRQRREVKVDDLLSSIKLRGVMNPIIVTPDLELVAGERRLEASRQLGLPDIPVRFTTELPFIDLKIIELEENLKRQDLHWRDHVAAIAAMHNLCVSLDPKWSGFDTAERINSDRMLVTRALRVYQDFNDPKIAGMSSLSAAYQRLAAIDQRKLGDSISELIEAGMGIGQEMEEAANGADGMGPNGEAVPEAPGGLQGLGEEAATPLAAKPPAYVTPRPASPPARPIDAGGPLDSTPEDILNVSFLDWAPSFTGKPFSLVHCDFPYGIGLFDGPAGSGDHRADRSGHKENSQHYEDTPKIYFELIQCLCENLDRVMAQSGHLVFWFSMQFYQDTLDIFRKLAPDLIFNPIPLVWLKSDGKGVVADYRRGPRNSYETAFLATRGDRFILKVKGNAYAAPSDKSLHPSAKPEPMLREFFEMLVDETSTLLDPTCGGGSSLRAAESLGAKRVLGLDINPDHCAAARSALRSFRTLRKVT